MAADRIPGIDAPRQQSAWERDAMVATNFVVLHSGWFFDSNRRPDRTENYYLRKVLMSHEGENMKNRPKMAALCVIFYGLGNRPLQRYMLRLPPYKQVQYITLQAFSVPSLTPMAAVGFLLNSITFLVGFQYSGGVIDRRIWVLRNPGALEYTEPPSPKVLNVPHVYSFSPIFFNDPYPNTYFLKLRC